jgi:hypothetical protein
MIECNDTDLWTCQDVNNTIVITTNGCVTNSGKAVMGHGIALQAKNRMSKLPKLLGFHINTYGNWVLYFKEYNLFTFPVKHNWWEKADLQLIRQSAEQLLDHVNEKGFKKVWMVRPGCGNGRLKWENVKPVIEFLDDRFIVVEK